MHPNVHGDVPRPRYNTRQAAAGTDATTSTLTNHNLQTLQAVDVLQVWRTRGLVRTPVFVSASSSLDPTLSFTHMDHLHIGPGVVHADDGSPPTAIRTDNVTRMTLLAGGAGVAIIQARPEAVVVLWQTPMQAMSMVRVQWMAAVVRAMSRRTRPSLYRAQQQRQQRQHPTGDMVKRHRVY